MWFKGTVTSVIKYTFKTEKIKKNALKMIWSTSGRLKLREIHATYFQIETISDKRKKLLN